jgi:hypothetical protein
MIPVPVLAIVCDHPQKRPTRPDHASECALALSRRPRGAIVPRHALGPTVDRPQADNEATSFIKLMNLA